MTDEFVEGTFGTADADPAAVATVRAATPGLPHDPSSEQAAAGVELVEPMGRRGLPGPDAPDGHVPGRWAHARHRERGRRGTDAVHPSEGGRGHEVGHRRTRQPGRACHRRPCAPLRRGVRALPRHEVPGMDGQAVRRSARSRGGSVLAAGVARQRPAGSAEADPGLPLVRPGPAERVNAVRSARSGAGQFLYSACYFSAPLPSAHPSAGVDPRGRQRPEIGHGRK